MGATRARLVDALWHGADPFVGFANPLPPDLQGWNSDHRFLTEAIDHYRPAVAVEIGVWKGGSVITMARRMRDAGIDGVVIAVDTWLGSAEHWLDRTFQATHRQHGYSLLYHQFISNVVTYGLQDYVLPLPLDSASAASVLGATRIRPTVLHVDGAHDTQSVVQDLTRWWPLILPGGTLIADDYDPTGAVWPSVQCGVNYFLSGVVHAGFEAQPYKARILKPRDPV